MNRDEPAEEGQGLRRRLAELEGAQEAEREWLALEVHDRIAQTLASVFQQLQAIESVARSSPEVRSLAVRASVLCREAIREARNIMKELRPPVLDELGFVPVMEEELRHLEEESGHQIKLGLACEMRPPRGIEMVLYRVFHEAITNIRKHAGASEVAVSMKSDQSAVLLQIEDNGVGFDVGEVLRKKRLGGLVSMQRRAQVAGGTCRIERVPSQGTRVSLWLPYGTEHAPSTNEGHLAGE
ncbi:MAG: sensor histidine kinase [Chloroflexota bacterium]|nr:sensor histidine kinase [Chloroflexota bacterium]